MPHSSFKLAITMRLALRSVVALSILLSIVGLPRDASAAPITMYITGHWGYWDLGMHTTDPGELAFEQAFGAYGIISGGCSAMGCNSTASMVSMTVWVDPTAPAPTPWLLGSILGATLRVGPLTYSMPQLPIGSPGGPFSGPSISANGITFSPQQMLFQDIGGPVVIVAFNPANYWAVVFPQTISVPEPSSLLFVSGAALALVIFRSRQRLRHRRSGMNP